MKSQGIWFRRRQYAITSPVLCNFAVRIKRFQFLLSHLLVFNSRLLRLECSAPLTAVTFIWGYFHFVFRSWNRPSKHPTPCIDVKWNFSLLSLAPHKSCQNRLAESMDPSQSPAVHVAQRCALRSCLGKVQPLQMLPANRQMCRRQLQTYHRIQRASCTSPLDALSPETILYMDLWRERDNIQ